MTVGELKEFLKDIPDEFPIYKLIGQGIGIRIHDAVICDAESNKIRLNQGTYTLKQGTFQIDLKLPGDTSTNGLVFY